MHTVSVLGSYLQAIHSSAIYFEQSARITPSNINNLVEKGGKAADTVLIVFGLGLHIIPNILHSDIFEQTTTIVIGDNEVGYLFDPQCRMDVAHVDFSLVSA